MKQQETRRIVPVSVVAIVVFALLVLFELMVMGGVLQIRSSTIARIAPWAYEPFLKLVGEGPDSRTRKEPIHAMNQDKDQDASGIASVAGLNPDAITINLEAEVPEEEPPAVTAPATEKAPSNAPPATEPKNPVPVG